MRACGAASQCVTCVPRAAAQEDRVEALGRMLRHHLAQRVCGELQVRAAVGLPPRSSFSITAAKYRDPQEGAIFASLAGGADDESSEMAEELQRFILRRVLLGWREESGRNGGGLVHAIAVWGLRLLSPPPPPSYLLSKKSFARDSIQGVTQSHSIFNSNKQYIPPIQGVVRERFYSRSDTITQHI